MKAGLQWLNGWMGGVNYIRNLAGALAFASENDRPEVHLFCDRNLPNYHKEKPDFHKEHFFTGSTTGHGGLRAKLARHRDILLHRDDERDLTKAVKEAGVDIIYPLINSRSKGCRAGIHWIPDFQFYYLPELIGLKQSRRMCWVKARIIRNHNARLVLSSLHAEKSAYEIYGRPNAKIDILRFTTVPKKSWYVNNDDVLQRFKIDKPYFIICNQFWMHKDHLTALKAFKNLITRRKDAACLVMTGELSEPRNPGYVKTLKEMISGLGPEHVRMLGLISRDDQMCLIRGSRAVIQPSRYEGWSTVLEDARAVGAQVIASDFPVHIEQAVMGARYFKQGDWQQLEDVMRELLSSREDIREGEELFLQQTDNVVEFSRQILEIFKKQLAEG